MQETIQKQEKHEQKQNVLRTDKQGLRKEISEQRGEVNVLKNKLNGIKQEQFQSTDASISSTSMDNIRKHQNAVVYMS